MKSRKEVALTAEIAIDTQIRFLARDSVDASSDTEFRSGSKAGLEVNVEDGLWVRHFLFLSGLESGGDISRARRRSRSRRFSCVVY
jgi:hypothetical protein